MKALECQVEELKTLDIVVWLKRLALELPGILRSALDIKRLAAVIEPQTAQITAIRARLDRQAEDLSQLRDTMADRDDQLLDILTQLLELAQLSRSDKHSWCDQIDDSFGQRRAMASQDLTADERHQIAAHVEDGSREHMAASSGPALTPLDSRSKVTGSKRTTKSRKSKRSSSQRRKTNLEVSESAQCSVGLSQPQLEVNLQSGATLCPPRKIRRTLLSDDSLAERSLARHRDHGSSDM